jgi:hypothetical protein
MENMPHGSVFCCGSGPRRLMGGERWRRYAVAGLVLAGLGLAAGCDNPTAQERIAVRERSFKWTADALAYRDKQSPERLKRDLEFLKRDEQKHEEMFARDLRRIQARYEYDVKRWQDRQDDYARKIEEMLRGKPENLERNAIILFY